jgi:hypothetical protein
MKNELLQIYLGRNGRKRKGTALSSIEGVIIRIIKRVFKKRLIIVRVPKAHTY